MASLYDGAVRFGKLGMFLSATGFSTAASFFSGSDAKEELTWVSASAFSSATFYSFFKNLGVAKNIRFQVDANSELRLEISNLIGRNEPLAALVILPERPTVSTPKALLSRQAVGFNQFSMLH